MQWNQGAGPSGWSAYSYPAGHSSHYYSQNAMQPHYANAYYYTQQGAPCQPTQIAVPSPGFSRNQPMGALVPPHMRNRTGPAKCGHEGCLFAGTHKEVEIHKMDRHLIFPPGWVEKGKGKRKRDDEDDYVDEEAQFRASGAISILGTDVKLDSPEAIAAWREERKKRWPSARRIAEKAQSRREALERGQILPEPTRLHRSTDGGPGRVDQSQRGRGRGRGRGRARGYINQPSGPRPGTNGARQAPITDPGWAERGRGNGRYATEQSQRRGRGRGVATSRLPRPTSRDGKVDVAAIPGPSSSSSAASSSNSDPGSDSETGDNSGPDMDPLKDAVPSKVMLPERVVEGFGPSADEAETVEVDKITSVITQPKKQGFKKAAPRPPKPAYNPFNQRPNLLRNLLTPDIQATVSNLSQAIRFLVANDFLENVELTPGDAENAPIQPMHTAT